MKIIKTSNIRPPIPTTSFDWCAWYAEEEGDDCVCGFGKTEQEAIQDRKDMEETQ